MLKQKKMFFMQGNYETWIETLLLKGDILDPVMSRNVWVGRDNKYSLFLKIERR